MNIATFISETKAIAMAEALENSSVQVEHTSVVPKRRRGEMQGYQVRVKWIDGRYEWMTEEQVENLDG